MIGIITFHRAVNYGAVFQTYALQTALEQLNKEVKVIDYRCEAIESPYQPKINTGNIKKAIIDLLLYRKKKSKQTAFYSFLDRKINLLPISKSNECSTVIVGSDQVWSKELTNLDLVYFGSIVKPNQSLISYAACTGKVGLSKEEASIVGSQFERFNAISVRDLATKKFVEDVVHSEIAKVVDPTLLLTKEMWENHCIEIPYENYILLFAVGYSERLSDFASDLAKKTKKKIIFLNSNLRKKGKGIYLDCVDPEYAFSLINKADYIVTNSFHGTAMSIAMEKEFYVELNHDKKGRNERVDDLLYELKIIGREILHSQFDQKDFNTIDWSIVRASKEKLRREGLKFLSSNIE